MARPERNTVDYFPHPCQNGRKMFFIKQKYGHEGYSIWYQILEELGNADFHYLDLSEETQLMYTSSQLMTTETRLREVITDLAKLNAINKYLWDKKSIVFSEKFVASINDAYKRRNNKCITLQSLCEHLRIKYQQLLDYCSNNNNNKPQSKVKKSKVLISKEEYLQSLNDWRSNIPDKNQWLQSLSKEYPDLNIDRSLRKIYDYWCTDEGYARKMKSKARTIDWKATFKNGLNMDFNQVPK